MTTNTLDGRVAIVTGCGGDTASNLALALAESGVRLCVADMNPDRAERVVNSIMDAGGDAFSWQLDTSNRFQVSAMIEETRKRYGRLDMLIHNAHVSPTDSVLKMDEWSWRRTMEVNLTGTFFCAQLVGRVLSDEDGGFILILTPSKPRAAATVATTNGMIAFAGVVNAELSEQAVVCQTAATTTSIESLLTQIKTNLP